MTARPDDDALSWGGDDDPTLDVGIENARPPVGEPVTDAPPPAVVRKPEPRVAVERPEPPAAAKDASANEPAGLGKVALVSLGLIAGAYLFFAIGWFIAGLRLQAVGGLPVSSVMLTVATLAAAAAPLVWFGVTFLLTRRSRTWVRFCWLIAGIVLLVPWPFIFTGALA